MMIGFQVGLLQFLFLSRSSWRSVLQTAQATKSNWCGPDREPREFNDNLWNTTKNNEMTHCRSWTSCGFHERYHSSSWLFVHIKYTWTQTLPLCFVLANKIRISPFYGHCLLDRLNYFLLVSQVWLMFVAEVAHQMCQAHHYLSGFLSCA